jgi:8-oxo-dGTP pyrophosphatase MutT (NUDIX family)
MAKEKPKLPLEHHYSAGGVLFRRSGEALEVCLTKPQGKDRWQLPKGMIDEGEKAPGTAVREVLEETGHRGRVLGDKLRDVEYWYVDKYGPTPRRVHKKVTFFLLELERADEGKPDPVEVSEARFFAIDEASRKIEFASEREVLDLARARLTT